MSFVRLLDMANFVPEQNGPVAHWRPIQPKHARRLKRRGNGIADNKASCRQELMMTTIKTRDGVEITIRTGAPVSPSCSAMAGRYHRMTGTRRCCSSSITAIASLPMTAAAMVAASQTGEGHDMDHYADDLAAVTAHLDLKKAIHVGDSTGGGEVVHYLARHGESRVAKAAILCAVPPLMVRTPANPTAFPRKSLTDFRYSSRPIARSSIATSPQVRSMATTGRAPNLLSPLSRIGGVRA